MWNELEFKDDEVQIRICFQERFPGNCAWCLKVSPHMSKILLGRPMVSMSGTRCRMEESIKLPRNVRCYRYRHTMRKRKDVEAICGY